MKHISEVCKNTLINIALSQKDKKSQKSKLMLIWNQDILSNDEYYFILGNNDLRGA